MVLGKFQTFIRLGKAHIWHTACLSGKVISGLLFSFTPFPFFSMWTFLSKEQNSLPSRAQFDEKCINHFQERESGKYVRTNSYLALSNLFVGPGGYWRTIWLWLSLLQSLCKSAWGSRLLREKDIGTRELPTAQLSPRGPVFGGGPPGGLEPHTSRNQPCNPHPEASQGGQPWQLCHERGRVKGERPWAWRPVGYSRSGFTPVRRAETSRTNIPIEIFCVATFSRLKYWLLTNSFFLVFWFFSNFNRFRGTPIVFCGIRCRQIQWAVRTGRAPAEHVCWTPAQTEVTPPCSVHLLTNFWNINRRHVITLMRSPWDSSQVPVTPIEPILQLKTKKFLVTDISILSCKQIFQPLWLSSKVDKPRLWLSNLEQTSKWGVNKQSFSKVSLSKFGNQERHSFPEEAQRTSDLTFKFGLSACLTKGEHVFKFAT